MRFSRKWSRIHSRITCRNSIRIWKAALNKVEEFLEIKKKLANIRQNVQESITDLDKSIGKIGVSAQA